MINGNLNRLTTCLDLDSGFTSSTLIPENVIAKIITNAKELAKN